MAIQLNERDYQIFKLLDEHQVLLEKHISWFVATENKPVLIRDRLRKLFYLDYLICQRHDNKLAWWATPTKPLVYMLAPLARTVCGAKQLDSDIYNDEWQRNRLEIANIRMLFIIAQREKHLQAFKWQTCHFAAEQSSIYDAIVSSNDESGNYNMGLINYSDLNKNLSERLRQELDSREMSHIMVISRDQVHQENLQKILADLSNHANVNSILLATHQDLYKSGLDKVQWQNLAKQPINFSIDSFLPICDVNFGKIEAA